jgi:hypothetical protein
MQTVLRIIHIHIHIQSCAPDIIVTVINVSRYQGEENQTADEKKGRRPPPSGRPFLLRRGTAGGTTGSFKRRSLKLRRSGKEPKEILDCDCKLVIKFILTVCKLPNNNCIKKWTHQLTNGRYIYKLTTEVWCAAGVPIFIHMNMQYLNMINVLNTRG